MKRFYLTNEQFTTKTIDGDEFIAFIGDANDYTCRIEDIKKDRIYFNVIESKMNIANPQINISLFQALAKGEKMELVAQKTTEIGISDFFPLYIKNCDVKPNTTKTTRLEKIIINACKQCGRSLLTNIHPIVNLNECLNIIKSYDVVLFANEREDSTRVYDVLTKHKAAKKIAIIIGPEGGFTEEEINTISSVATSVSFGKRILRTETASIYLTSIINDFYRN